jgi:hypothetical protein
MTHVGNGARGNALRNAAGSTTGLGWEEESQKSINDRKAPCQCGGSDRADSCSIAHFCPASGDDEGN